MNSIEQRLMEAELILRIGGQVAYTSQGKKLKSKIENCIRNNLILVAEEVELPLLLNYEELKLDKPIRFGRYLSSFRTSTDGQELLLARTSEEAAADYFSQRKDPKVIFQIKQKCRPEKTEDLSPLKRREFTMCDAYSFDPSEEKMNETYQEIRECFRNILDQLNIPHAIAQPPEEICKETFNVQSEELTSTSGIELGHIYQLGNTYTTPYGLEQIMMGSYGLGVDRLLAAVAFGGNL